MRPQILMADPAYFEVRYAINPWMRPQDWAHEHRHAALSAWRGLKDAIETAGAQVTIIDAAPEWPDMVFTANLAVVFNGRCVPAQVPLSRATGGRNAFPKRPGIALGAGLGR